MSSTPPDRNRGRRSRPPCGARSGMRRPRGCRPSALRATWRRRSPAVASPPPSPLVRWAWGEHRRCRRRVHLHPWCPATRPRRQLLPPERRRPGVGLRHRGRRCTGSCRARRVEMPPTDGGAEPPRWWCRSCRPGSHRRGAHRGRPRTRRQDQARASPQGLGDDRVGRRVGGHGCASSRMRRIVARARDNRDATVPGATPRISAAVRLSKPSPSTSTTGRWSSGRAERARRAWSAASTARSGPAALVARSSAGALTSTGSGWRRARRSSSMRL